ncbi:coenzyme Q biosynthesis Coq4 [Basidiobolus meristosporus CBS 931.73]|uniref:4-hydroxy-3-methoxy-5-polyprenylbenzoate decarboxylase n=1 Tax=Basidiobolus meristosporus CBS 931.73 TaxID=1314790 RepID=A0A1Y1YE21_9FUNG|nr:coenzyme Q biosynthesis Coq4 [Basidiobolus meristosporus CBS 931.73]|eukprot:ORX96252.1 coenzyme Q biosynthesis Coq4 [Basidiobolus meristosporus CBS 931.73]
MVKLPLRVASAARTSLLGGQRRAGAIPIVVNRALTSFEASRGQPLYEGHIPTSPLEKGALSVKAAFTALFNPLRGDMVAVLGETTGSMVLARIRDKMLLDPVGRRILRERPVLNSKTLNLPGLRTLPDGTFGREYVRWLDEQQVTPDTRAPVHYVDDPELAYVIRRYRETHDFYHALTGIGISVEDELALKWFEFAQTGLPMTLLGSVFGPLRLPSVERKHLFEVYVPWAIRCGSNAKFLMNVMYEESFDKPLDEFRKELGIYLPPKA